MAGFFISYRYGCRWDFEGVGRIHVQGSEYVGLKMCFWVNKGRSCSLQKVDLMGLINIVEFLSYLL